MYPGMAPLGPMGPMPMPMPMAMPMAIPAAVPGPMGIGFAPAVPVPVAPMPMPMPMGGGGGGGGNGGGNGGGKGGGGKMDGGGGLDARTAAVAATRKRTAAGQESRHEIRERMRYIMYEIDETNNRFISGRSEPFQFLDVCCCPGGFSTYSLTAGAAPRKGIGLSLPPELGGHLPSIEQETDKYLLHFVDVTTVAAGIRVGSMRVELPGSPRPALQLDAAPDAPPMGNCQLVILDGSFLGGKDWIHKETTMPDSENPAFNVYGSNAAAHKALLVAQLIVMANNLAPGGVLVLRLNMFADMFTAGVLGLLRHVFHGDVASYKPRSCHVHRGSYYLVCTGFDPHRAYCMQWVPRWYACLASLRSQGPAPRFVPFPGLHLDTQQGLGLTWTRALYVYHVHLWRFAKLVEVAMEEKAMLDQRLPMRPRTGRFTHSCGRIFAGVPCSGRCNAAHSFEELHPFVQKAFREPRGFLHMPGSLALLQAPLANTDPLPETLLELKQQAHVQAVLQAQAAAANQRAALAAAAAAGGGGNLLGHVGSYDSAVEMGMGGEWVHGLVHSQQQQQQQQLPQQQQTGMGPAAAAAAAASEGAAGETGFRLLMREDDDVNVMMEGGFDDDGPAAPGTLPVAQPAQQQQQQQQQPLLAASPLAAVADEASSAVNGGVAAATADDAGLEFATTVEAAGKTARHGAAGGAFIRPELLRMSAYQPRLSLVTVEIDDDDSLAALLDYLGR